VLTGLLPGTTYYYQLVTVADGLTSVYATQTFTTSGTAPIQSDSGTPAMPSWALVLLAMVLVGISAIFLNRRGPDLAS